MYQVWFNDDEKGYRIARCSENKLYLQNITTKNGKQDISYDEKSIDEDLIRDERILGQDR